MQENTDALFQDLFRYAELIQAREAELGAYPGDGLTSEKAIALVKILRPISEAESASSSVLWTAFRTATEAQMSWLFPERDPLGEPMTAALRKIQTFVGIALETVMPEMKPDLERYADLAIVENAARRTQATRGNKIIWRLWFARVLYRLGSFLSRS